MITAVRRHAGQSAIAAPDTGGLRSDLLAALQIMRSSLSGQDAALILGLLIGHPFLQEPSRRRGPGPQRGEGTHSMYDQALPGGDGRRSAMRQVQAASRGAEAGPDLNYRVVIL